MNVFLSPIAERKIELLLEFIEIEWSKKSQEYILGKI